MNVLRLLQTRLNFGNWSLRRKVIAGLMAAAITPLLIYAVVSGYARYEERIAMAGTSLSYAAQVGSELMGRDIARALDEAYVVSRDQLVSAQVGFFARSAYDNPDASISNSLTTRMRAVLQEQLVAHPFFVSIRLLTPDGLLLVQFGDITTTPSLTSSNQNDHPGFAQIAGLAFPEGRTLLLQPYPEPRTGVLMLEGVIPVHDFGELVGYLVFTLDTEQLITAPLEEGSSGPEAFYDTQYVYLLDADGWLLTETQGAAPFSQQVPLETNLDTAGHYTPRYDRVWGDEPIRVLGNYVTNDQLGWTVVAEIRYDDVVDPLVADLLGFSVPILAIVLLVGGLLLYTMTRQMVDPLSELTRTAEQIAAGDLDLTLEHTDRRDEIGSLRNAVVIMTDALRSAIAELERRVQARTRDIELVTVIGREASSLRDIHTLLQHTVDQIIDNFPLIYHAQVFLIDDTGEFADLTVSTGAPGRELLRRGHRLSVGSVSVIGRVTEIGQTVIARDTSTSRVHQRNEFLPDTRAEMALPLRSGDQIIGALDVQSKAADAFTPEEQRTFEALAAQLAIAIDNARRFTATSRRAAEVESLYRMLTRANWQELLGLAQRQGFLDASAGLSSEDTTRWSEWQRAAMIQQKPVFSPELPEGGRILAVPILTRGEVLGAVEWHLTDTEVNENTRLMAEQLTERLATTLETVRLLERSEQLAQREQLLNRISSRLMAEPNVHLILDTAVHELAAILQTPQVSIQLRPTTNSGPTNGDRTPEAPSTESAT
ncbi:MAG: GAF domain-containing protein [Anaerolineae bacterium]|nr:GAF domain-containing protein [Anaerolineae bacterium]